MITTDPDQRIKEAMETCFEGSKVLHLGYCFHDNKIAMKGLKQIKAGIDVIDSESATGRDVFLSRIDDVDPDVAVISAAAVLQSHTERAKVRLRYLHDICVTEHWFSSMNLLFFKGDPSICPPDPRFPKLGLECGSEWFDDPAPSK